MSKSASKLRPMAAGVKGGAAEITADVNLNNSNSWAEVDTERRPPTTRRDSNWSNTSAIPTSPTLHAPVLPGGERDDQGVVRVDPLGTGATFWPPPMASCRIPP